VGKTALQRGCQGAASQIRMNMLQMRARKYEGRKRLRPLS
jgi:hypothetical protein